MPRLARTVAIGMPHHVTQRGNYRQQVFRKKEDYQNYIQWIKEYSKKYELAIIGYCLMSNHVHFIVVPYRENSMAMAFNMTHMRYSQYMNKKLKAFGHLWQGRFYSCIMDDEHMIEALRYVERNPVRAKMVKKAWDWEWSSTMEHIGEGKGELELEESPVIKAVKKGDWKGFIVEKDNEEFVKDLRKRTAMGRPFVRDRILRKLEDMFDRKLGARDPWRPKKERNK